MSTLLIVDDDPRQRETIVRAAHEVGITEISQAGTEMEAKKLVGDSPFQLAVVDIMLSDPPGKEEGLGVIGRLNALQPGCRIIALTTKVAGTETGVKALNAGAHDFISSKWDHVNWYALLVLRLALWKGVVEGKRPPANTPATKKTGELVG